jgi:hypothetical protein
MPAGAAARSPDAQSHRTPSHGAPSHGAPGHGAPRHDALNHGFIGGAIITIAGALLTAGIVTAALVPGLIASRTTTLSGPASDAEPTLSALAASEIAAAIPTLDPATSQAAVADAKSCNAPLAWVVLVKQPGSAAGTVRIRSGSYLSPAFHVTEVAQRIAIPYPAPYASGRGVLSLVGQADGLWFYLTPGWFNPTLNGAASINVVWTPGNPC